MLHDKNKLTVFIYIKALQLLHYINILHAMPKYLWTSSNKYICKLKFNAHRGLKKESTVKSLI